MTVDKNTYLIELSESNRTSFGRIDFRDQVEEQQVFSAIWELESQVNNGGFAQYFTSADGHTANFAPEALRRIGANNCSDIVSRALHAVSPDLLPDDQPTREKIIDELDKKPKRRWSPWIRSSLPTLTTSQSCCLNMCTQTHRCLVTFLPSNPPNKAVNRDAQTAGFASYLDASQLHY